MTFETIFTMDSSSIKYGPGATRELGDDMAQLGARRVMVVTDPRLASSEPVAISLDSLRRNNIDAVLFDQVQVEPTDASLAAAIQFATEGNFEGYVAVGGGSSMDTAKVANLYATYPADFLAYVNPPIGDGRPVPGRLKPLIAVPTTAGTGSETTGVAIFDLLEMQAIVWEEDDLGAKPLYQPVSVTLQESAQAARNRLIEQIVETDDELTLKYLEGEEITPAELRAALRNATLSSELTPVFCGSALKNKGVQPLLDAIVDLLPSPLDVEAIEGINPYTNKVEFRDADDGKPATALVFKIATDPYVGRLAYLRLYSGRVKAGQTLLNPANNKRERLNRLVRMYADRRQEVKEVYAGDIIAVPGLKRTFTGDTLCEPKGPIVLETITFPEPVISVAIEPRTAADQDKMTDALSRLAEEDPTFQVRTNEQTGQLLISGMGELHLEVLVNRLLREFRVQANVGKPRVAYRETITEPVRGVEGRFIRQTGGRGQYGVVELNLFPAEPGAGNEFIERVQSSVIPAEYIPSIKIGVMEAMESGVIAGYPLVDVRAVLVGGSHHDEDSSDIAFKVAGSIALQEGVQRGKPALLEPVMKVEVVVPEEFTGEVLGNLSSRRADIGGMEPRSGGVQVIDAIVPLAEMFGYATQLRSMSQGRGVFTMEFDHYNQVSKEIMDAITGGGIF